LKIPSSFFNRSAFNVDTPFIYSMGLANMFEPELIKLVFYKYISGAEIICHRSRETQKLHWSVVEKTAGAGDKDQRLVLFWKRLGLLKFLFPVFPLEDAALNSGVSPNSSGICALGTGFPNNFSMARNLRCSFTLTKV
jgi:hypothetical protein